MRVSGDSMAPTHPSGSVVLVVRPGLDRLLGTPAPARPGDVVVVAAPGGGLTLKRVVAVGPSTIEIAAGRVTVDGEPVPAPVTGQAGSSDLPPTRLEPGEVFVLGDDRRPLASRDSRDYGPLPASALRGRVVAPSR